MPASKSYVISYVESKEQNKQKNKKTEVDSEIQGKKQQLMVTRKSVKGWGQSRR